MKRGRNETLPKSFGYSCHWNSVHSFGFGCSKKCDVFEYFSNIASNIICTKKHQILGFGIANKVELSIFFAILRKTERRKNMVAFIILLALIVWLVIANVRIVPQAFAYVIESLGVYKTVWGAGLHLKVPVIERIVKKVSLKEQVLDFPPQPVITKDNVTMQIDSVVFCKVFDPKLYAYGVENPMQAVENLTATTLRSIIGDMELDQTLTSREEINSKMLSILDEATDAWGLNITRVEVKNLSPSADVLETMTIQMKAERERRQTVLEAQAHRESVVSRAEGDKQAKILAAEAERDAQIALAEGKAKSIEMVYQAEAEGLQKLNEAKISENVLRLKGIEALKDVSDGRATKIYMPSDIASVISNLGVAGEALGIGDATSIDISPKPEKPLDSDPCIDEETGKGGVEASIATRKIHKDVEKQYTDFDE